MPCAIGAGLVLVVFLVALLALLAFQPLLVSGRAFRVLAHRGFAMAFHELLEVAHAFVQRIQVGKYLVETEGRTLALLNACLFMLQYPYG